MHVCVSLLPRALDLSSGLEGGLTDVAIEVLHILLSHLLQNSGGEEMGMSRENIDTFVQTLRRGVGMFCVWDLCIV